MRIGIEAQRIFRKKKHGMDFVALAMIQCLQEIDNENEYFVFVNEQEDMTVLNETANFKIICLPNAPYPIWEQYHLPRAVKQYKCDLLHCTSNTAPIHPKVPLFVTLHDIIYLEKIDLQQGSWYQRLGNIYRKWNVPKVVKKARKIFTVSKFEQQRIVNHFGINDRDVIVTYNGAGNHFKPTSEAKARAILKKYNLPNKYILFLGNTDPKKNLINVVKAVWQVKQAGQMDFKLVMPDFGEDTLLDILKKIDATPLRKDIHLTGYVSNFDLPAIYQKAEMFLYPSLRESFGIPILEAMACGCSVITSNVASMPEVAGNAALLIDPTKPNQLADSISKLQLDNQLRASLIARGFERAPQFSYMNTARLILKTYKKELNDTLN